MAQSSVATTTWFILWCVAVFSLTVITIIGFVYSMIMWNDSHVHTYCVFMTNEWVAPLPATGGDTNAYGFGFVSIDLRRDTITYSIETVNISPDVPSALEIRGPTLIEEGDQHVTGLDPTLSDEEIMSGSKEFHVHSTLTDIVEKPYLYYILIITTGHTSGSIADRLGRECNTS